MQKPTLPQGFRDFSPKEVKQRTYIINTIKHFFENFGFEPLETTCVENLNTLTGKYGEEGDKLLFKILNSGDFLQHYNNKTTTEPIPLDHKKMLPHIAQKGLRYDLTVPFARYVVMNHHTLTFPFKRYQVQPVWRADRPQKGRYREFYQCDADVVGSDSLLNEVELLQIFDQVFNALGVQTTILVNNRKILAGIAECCNCPNQLIDLTVAIDKLDKIGLQGVENELLQKNFSEQSIHTLKSFLIQKGTPTQILDFLNTKFEHSIIGQQGVQELKTVFEYLQHLPTLHNTFAIDLTLARGLNYYTGFIVEVKSNQVSIGSIASGGRYDNLTGAFGIDGLSGVGISFGIDRIYDVMDELGLFKNTPQTTTKVLFTNLAPEPLKMAFNILQQFRAANIAAEIYPDQTALKKQMKYANAKNIPFVILMGNEEAEMAAEGLHLKEMETGEQGWISIEQAIEKIKTA